jgi:hypothetical protein
LTRKRERWLSEAEGVVPSHGLEFYTDGYLFEGRTGSGVFSEELDLKEYFAMKFTPFWLVLITV